MIDEDLDLNVTTADKVLRLMAIGDIWIERHGKLGFYFAVERMSGRSLPINQSLATSVIQNAHVTHEEWREGWEFANPTGVFRWVIGGDF